MQLAFLSVVAASSCIPLPNPIPFSPGFDMSLVSNIAQSIPSHSWEFGTASQALLELHNSSLSVFGCNPFASRVDSYTVQALQYAERVIVISGDDKNALANGDGAVGDPASLGVVALMLGRSKGEFWDAAERQMRYILEQAPRFDNGAISHRVEQVEAWADFVYMVPPFMAYYAVVTKNVSLLQQAVEQCRAYRDILRNDNNLWKHIINPSGAPDGGLWSTGNAWAAAGMTRVLATLMKAPFRLEWRRKAVRDLTSWIKEIIDTAVTADLDGGLVRNYVDDGSWLGEISGSSLLAAVIYRMAVLQPREFAASDYYTNWADGIRRVIAGYDSNGSPHVTRNGIVTPAVNPLGWWDRNPFTTGSPEGQSFVVMMYAAWRDCVLEGKCSYPQGVEHGSEL